MSSLSIGERKLFESMLGMASGYVLVFSDNTFRDFFAETVGVDIHSEKYCIDGRSKAKKLRAFWALEPDHTVGKLLIALVQQAQTLPGYRNDELAEQCLEVAQRLLTGQIDLTPLKEVANRFDAQHLSKQIRRMEDAVESDPALAIGTAKELVETCCKTILSERGWPLTGKEDISTLTKAVAKELRLVPEGVPDEARGRDVIRRILRSLGSIGNDIAELRGLYGTGHGKDGRAKGLTARHARLAVGTAATLARFLFDTHSEIT